MVTRPEIAGLTDWRPLARGGFATVFSARQESLNRRVAVKVDQRRLDTPAERERFLREAGAAGRMSGHPGIVTVHDAGLLSDDRPYLVMELCTGGSLTRRVEAEHRPDAGWVRDVGVRIADALAAAHAQGVLHRDVKPANVLIDGYGHAGLADFGLALMPDPGMEPGKTLEALTPAYAAPETFVPHTPTPAGDVYSLAATLYALLGGHPPRAEDNEPTDLETAVDRLGQPVQPLADVDPALMGVVLVALADDPADRPDAAAFRDALAGVPLGAPTEGVGVTVSKRRPGDEPADPTGGRPRWLVPAIVAAVTLAVLGGIAAVFGPGAQRTSTAPAPTASPVGAPAPTSSGLVSPSGSSSSAVRPAGFVDCGEAVRAGVFCGPEPPQCWGGLASAFDAPIVATPASCRKNHVYQTFAARRLDFVVRRQSQLDQDSTIKRVCSAGVVNAMLAPRDRREDWEVYAIPPQTERAGDDYVRCVFGRGERTRPLALTVPR